MRLLVDAAPLLALAEPVHPQKSAILRILLAEPELPALSPFAAAEVDYLLQRRGGLTANRAFIDDLAARRFSLECVEAGDLAVIASLNERYKDLSPGVTDLSLVALAARLRTTRILTLDQRHFRILRPLQGGTFTLLPFDEDVT